jgi:hypothetical protein
MLTFALVARLSRPALLMFLFFQENGFVQDIGRVMDACKCSKSSYYASLRVLQNEGLLQHDHVHKNIPIKRIVQKTANPSRPVEPDAVDPLVAQLVAEGFEQGPAKGLLTKVGADQVARQLERHAERKTRGYAFRGNPAAFLWMAILNDWSPMKAPDAPGLIEDRERKIRERGQPARETQAVVHRTITTARMEAQELFYHGGRAEVARGLALCDEWCMQPGTLGCQQPKEA